MKRASWTAGWSVSLPVTFRLSAMRPPNRLRVARASVQVRRRRSSSGGAREREQAQIHKVVKSRAAIEGAGVHLRRAIGFGPPEEYDPFLLLDDFRSDKPDHYFSGFPWHPHRGMDISMTSKQRQR